jgi:hypothetical protein
MGATLVFPAERLHISAWTDPVIDQLGHDPRSAYVERFWLGILGPSTTWLLRTLAYRLDLEPEGLDLDLVATAKALGLGTKGGQQSPFLRALSRSCQFGLAQQIDGQHLAVRRRLPPLSRRQVERLPDDLRAEHAHWNERGAPAASATELRARAKRLALTLVELGEDFDATERQLHRWRFHPAMAHEATTWAWQRTRGAVEPVGSGPAVAGPAVGEPTRRAARVASLGAPTVAAVTDLGGDAA